MVHIQLFFYLYGFMELFLLVQFPDIIAIHILSNSDIGWQTQGGLRPSSSSSLFLFKSLAQSTLTLQDARHGAP